MEDGMNLTAILGFLALPLGYLMRLMYGLINNYGWTIIIFTFLIRILMFPLTIQQQKSMARNAAFAPMMEEIRKKWANDKNRQNEELMKFQQENNMKMTAGCLPMVANMIVLFSIIAVIQAPLNYLVRMPAAQITSGVAIVRTYDPELGKKMNTFTQESILIGEVRQNPDLFTQETVYTDEKTGEEFNVVMEQQWVDAILDFKFDFFGINLAAVPQFAFSLYLILPLLSILTSFLSQFIMSKTSGQTQSPMQFWTMAIFTAGLFGWYAFTVPVGFSLYYTVSNIAMTLQQLLVKQIHDPEKEKQKILEEMEARKKAKKTKKQIVEVDKRGNTQVKEVSESELARIRLAKARELDAERYGDETATPASPQKEKEEK